MAVAMDSSKMITMDSALWSKLPEEQLFEILARLPYRSLAQYRTVCKTWDRAIPGMWKCGNNLRSGASVVEEHTNKYWFVCPDGLCYNPTINKNHQIKFYPSHQVERVLATSGGLMLCAMSSHWESGEPQLCVCNPFKETCWTLLPERPPPDPYHGHVDMGWELEGYGIVVDEDTHTFKVVLVISWGTGFNLGYSVPFDTLVYDSRTKSWKSVRESALDYGGEDVVGGMPNPRGVCYEDDLVFTDWDSCFQRVYNSKLEDWYATEIPDVGTTNNQLQKFGDRLFLMGEEEGHVQIWECQRDSADDELDSSTWLQVGSLMLMLLPENPLQTWRGSNSKRTPVLAYFRPPRDPILVFDMEENAWYQVSDSSETRLSKTVCLEQIEVVLFEPRLEACACS